MALSLASIHQPLTDFFLNQFKTDAGSSILFRFDKFGSVVSDQDFIDPNHPELGYLSALAMEKFSDLVNHIPIDTGDGMNVLLSADSIDTTYFFRLLTPSIPYIPTGIDDDTKQAIINAFSSIKADCLKVWNNLKLESITGLMLQYKPSLATPANWYDKSNNEVWTSHSFQITETSSEPAPSSSNQLWRLKLSDAVMLRALQLPTAEIDATDRPPLNIAARVSELRAAPISAGRLAAEAQVAPRIADLSSSVALHNTYLQQFTTLDVSQRLLVNQHLGNNAPTQTVKTSSISISFDYCLVNIRRPWYVDAFINEKSWYVPTVPKGQVTSSGSAGNLPLIPIGFVAIRNLNIEANWATEDVTNASVATDFGPFKVTADIVNNKLSHPGLQVIGWVLQKMPDLPPNPPNDKTQPPNDPPNDKTLIDLNGIWAYGGTPGPVISVNGNLITVDMSAYKRPSANGSIVDSSTITLTFPDDATYTGKLQLPNTIKWSNGSAWTKV